MSTSKPDNTERNARILDLARQGKAPAEIARALGRSRGTVSGVIRRTRDAGTLSRIEPPVARERPQDGTAEGHGKGAMEEE